MNAQHNKMIVLLVVALVLASTDSRAATEWLFAGPGANCIDPVVDCSNKSISESFSILTDQGPVITGAWSTASGSDVALKAAQNAVLSRTGASPWLGHQIDDSGPRGAILFDLQPASDIKLEGIKLGWVTDGPGSYAGYVDFTRLAFTGTVSADLELNGMLFDYEGASNLIAEGWLQIGDFASVADDIGLYTGIEAD